MSESLFIDLETFAPIAMGVKKVGAYRHAEHAEVLLISYAIGDAPARVVDLASDENLTDELADALEDPRRPVIAHNAMFDRVVLRDTLGIAPELTRWRCSMVKAFTCGLPGKLDLLCEILHVPQDLAKIKDGNRLIKKFCAPTSKGRRRGPDTDPDDWARFVEYATNDVEAMREVWRRLPDWVYRGRELQLWHIDQRINDRGLPIDRALMKAAIAAVKREVASLHAQCAELTEGAVPRLTCVEKLKDWLAANGVAMKAMDKAAVSAALHRSDLPDDARTVLQLRQQAAKSSTSKYTAVEKRISADGRLRGSLQHYGAKRTGRHAGRGFQPQNLPSRGLEDEATAVRAILNDTVDLLYDSTMHAASEAIRGIVKAGPEHVIEAADLSNIEGRKLAWLADEEWKLEAFRAFDRGEAPDSYVQAYSRSFGVPIDEVDKARRQVGKIQELALGFHGGVNALVNMAISNGLDPADMVEPVMATAKGAAINRATDEYSWARANGRHCGLPLEQYAALAVIRSSWRDAHPNVVKLWGALERAALAAIRTPGETYPAGSKLRLSVRSFKGHSWLLMRLPSGRFLAYFNPRIVERQGRPVITFWDTDPYTGIWCEQQTYSGKLAENATQASSRCVLFDALYRAEAIEQIPIVTHVHDELVSERERAFLTPSLVELLPVNPSWCPDLPLAATGFIDARYHK